MLKFKVTYRKEGSERSTIRRISVTDIQDAIRYSLDQFICQPNEFDYADYGKMGVEPKIVYLHNDENFVEFTFHLDPFLKGKKGYIIQIEIDNSNLPVHGGYI